MIAASHDRRFIQQFGGDLFEVRDGRLIQHLGGYEAYVEFRYFAWPKPPLHKLGVY